MFDSISIHRDKWQTLGYMLAYLHRRSHDFRCGGALIEVVRAVNLELGKRSVSMGLWHFLSFSLLPSILIRDRPKPLFPVTAVTETAAETTFSVLAETETTPNYDYNYVNRVTNVRRLVHHPQL